jgi:hypothetical protein
VLHELGYSYSGTSSPSIQDLTLPEVRRLLEGKRVDGEITRLMQQQARADTLDGTDGGRDLRGRAVPRQSDEALLSDYADRMDRGEVGQNTLSMNGNGSGGTR